MYREKKAISLVILTLFVYATNIYFDSNSFILPFPIFDFILFVIALQFAFWNREDLFNYRKWYFFIYFTAIIFKLLMNPFFWGIFLDEIKLENFLNNGFLEYFKLAYTLSSIYAFICWSYLENLKMRFLWVGIICTIQFIGLFEPLFWGMYIGYGVFTCYVLIQIPRSSLSYILPIHSFLDLVTLSILIFQY